MGITHPSVPFEMIRIDFLGPLPTTEDGNSHILVITDYATRWVEAFATKDQKAETVANILINEIICRHSAPRQMLSDQGRNFLSKVVKEMCDYFVIKKLQTTAYHPETNGLTERFNATLCQMLSVYCNENQTNWDVYLPITLFAYRTSVNKTTRRSPFELKNGYAPRLPANVDKWSPNSYFMEDRDLAWKKAQELVKKSAEKSSKRLAERTKEPRVPEVGEFLRLKSPVTKTGLKTKLRRDIYQGPYEVTKTFENGNVDLSINGKYKTVHLNRTKPGEPLRSRYGRTYRKPDWYRAP